MSVSTATPQVPTSQLLTAIASESVALARKFGLSPVKASIKGAGNATAVTDKRINVQIFWGPIDFPDGFPANWK